MTFNWKYKYQLLFTLIGILIILIILALIKKGILTINNLEELKNYFNLLTKIISSFILTIGAVFSYYRFFKGRTFSERININVQIKVFEYSNNSKIHTIDLELKNTGNVPIKNVSSEVLAVLIDGEENEIYAVLTDEEIVPEDFVNIIDTQEIDSRHYKIKVPNDIKAVLFKIKVTSRKKNIWTKIVTIPNKDEYEYK